MPAEIVKKTRWGDEEDEEEQIEILKDSNGVKERVKFSVNAKGQKVKITQKVRVKEYKTRVPLRVFDRKSLPRFGDAKVGEENVTLPSRDFVSIEHPDDQMNEDTDDPTLAKTLANFISKQQERNIIRDNDMGDLMDDMDGRDNYEVGGGDGARSSSGGPQRYVAPGSRNTAGGGTSMDAGKERDGTENTLRVSNLTKAVTEDDLRDLFERFGRIHRISLPRIERDGVKEPRGFAYIAYARREDAEVALERLQGYGYDHLIIKLEWAKPTVGGGGGNESQFRSGYGKALVQDTTDKVLFASNLTGNN